MTTYLNLIMAINEAIDAMKKAEEKANVVRMLTRQAYRDKDQFKVSLYRMADEIFETTGDNATTLIHLLREVERKILQDRKELGEVEEIK
ncbi:hypothetical protein KQH61_06115 [bacterium]|nr:hypothetical protein [bacterium]